MIEKLINNEKDIEDFNKMMELIKEFPTKPIKPVPPSPPYNIPQPYLS